MSFGVAILGCLLAAPVSDVAAVSVVGPQLVTAGAAAAVARDVALVAGAEPELLTLRYRLEPIQVAGGGGSAIEIATLTSDVFGAFVDSIVVPTSVAAGLYRWELAVDPVPGETALDDNSVVGGEVVVLPPSPEPCIGGPAAIDVFCTIGQPGEPDPVALTVAQCVPTPLLLSWFAVVDPPAPWLELSATAGVVGAGEAQPLIVTFHALALPPVPQVLETVVSIALVTDVAKSVAIPVRLEIGEARFDPGDVITGAIDAPGETDGAWFEGVKGMKLRLAQGAGENAIALHATLFSAAQAPLASVAFKPGAAQKATFTLAKSGRFLLSVRASGAATGGWTLHTSRKLPKGGASAPNVTGELKTKPPGDSGPASDLKFLALKGATVVARLKPSIYIEGIYTIGLDVPELGVQLAEWTFDPSTAEIVLGPATLPASGLYKLGVTAPLPKPQKVKFELDVAPPPPGSATVTVP